MSALQPPGVYAAMLLGPSAASILLRKLRLRQFRGYAIGVWKEEQKKENNEGSEYGGIRMVEARTRL